MLYLFSLHIGSWVRWSFALIYYGFSICCVLVMLVFLCCWRYGNVAVRCYVCYWYWCLIIVLRIVVSVYIFAAPLLAMYALVFCGFVYCWLLICLTWYCFVVISYGCCFC